MPSIFRWDIFGRVVDNFGDAGVGWRLARELAAEHSHDVTLWQDDLAPLARILPGLDPAVDVAAGDGRDASALDRAVRRDLARRCRRRGVRLRTSGELRRSNGSRGDRARLVHPRILECGELGRGRARASVAASAAPAAATFLVPGLHGQDRRPPPRARNAGCARRVSARQRRAVGAVVHARSCAAGVGRNPRLALLLSESGAAGAARCLVRRRRHDGVPSSRRYCDRRTRLVDRRATSRIRAIRSNEAA